MRKIFVLNHTGNEKSTNNISVLSLSVIHFVFCSFLLLMVVIFSHFLSFRWVVEVRRKVYTSICVISYSSKMILHVVCCQMGDLKWKWCFQCSHEIHYMAESMRPPRHKNKEVNFVVILWAITASILLKRLSSRFQNPAAGIQLGH